MPIVGVNRDRLFEALGRSYTDEEFDQLCFEYGIELDDVTSEKEIISKMNKEDEANLKDASEEIIYKIDIPANRYDMLCLEGISRALNIFKGQMQPPNYRLANMNGKPLQQLIVKPETALVRPFVVAAILRGVKFDPIRYNSFIDLQDKLHQTLCRQRSLVAIGTHDLSTISGPFTYEALPPSEISFVPLKQSRAFRADELMEYYLANDQKLKKFVPLIKDSIVYPAIYDAKRTLLSLPPIINGAHSAISLDTRDVFIECTATDLTKAKVVLNTVACMFSAYCTSPFEVEPVEVVDAFGEVAVYPDLSSSSMEVSVDIINSSLGLQLGQQQMGDLLSRMSLAASPGVTPGTLVLRVPPTRSDVLHACDVVEDVAIAYGYNNIPTRIPGTYTQGRELPINQLTELLRLEASMSGYTEILTWALCSRQENFAAMRQPTDSAAVSIGNPATIEFEVCRTTLLPSALKTIGANKENPLPIRLFEISDVILVDPERETGAANQRRLVAVHCARESGFEVTHGFLNRLMEVLGVSHESAAGEAAAAAGRVYSWRPSQQPSYFPGRQAAVLYQGVEVGVFGVVHPEVLETFEIPYPVSALEINLEPFCFNQHGKMLM